MFKQYTSLVDEEEKHTNLRGLMDFEYPKKGVKLEEVESVDSIVTRFKHRSDVLRFYFEGST